MWWWSLWSAKQVTRASAVDPVTLILGITRSTDAREAPFFCQSSMRLEQTLALRPDFKETKSETRKKEKRRFETKMSHLKHRGGGGQCEQSVSCDFQNRWELHQCWLDPQTLIRCNKVNTCSEGYSLGHHHNYVLCKDRCIVKYRKKPMCLPGSGFVVRG